METENIRPNFIKNKIFRKILKQYFNKQTRKDKIFIYTKRFFTKNWYIFLISVFVIFILFLKFRENKKRKELFNNEDKKEELNKCPLVTNYQQIQRNGFDVNNSNFPEYIF